MAAVKAAKDVIAKDRDQVETMSKVDTMGNPYKKGGLVKKFRHHDGIAQKGKTRA